MKEKIEGPEPSHDLMQAVKELSLPELFILY